VTFLAAAIVLVSVFSATCVAGTVQSGVLNLANHDLYQDGNIRLDWQWQFFQGVALPPAAFLKPGEPEPDGYYPVPGYWTSYKDLSLPQKGEATYRVLVTVRDKNRPVSLLIPEIFTEYRLFVNGHLMDSHGRYSDGHIRFLSPRIYTFHNSRDTIDILINLCSTVIGSFFQDFVKMFNKIKPDVGSELKTCRHTN